MNVLDGRLLQDDGGLGFVLDDGTRLPLQGRAVPAAWIGRPLRMGVRPEHLLRDGAGGSGFAPLVEVVEPVGNEVFVNLVLGARALVARLPPGVLPEPGTTLPLRVDGERAHFFDPADGARLQG
jgi:multiple sugar transport system ATP-binding protein